MLMAVDPTTAAVVLIEFQNDFTSDGGALHGAVLDVMDSTDMLENTKKLVADARAAGATIIHAPISFADGYNEITDHPYGILAGVVDSKAFVKDTWGSAIVEDLAPQADDIVIEGKRGLDTFASTNLDFILRSKGIKTVALGGFLTNCCVESTMRSAYEKGFDVVTLTDCVAATSQAEHDNAIQYDYPMFSRPMTSDAFATQLKGQEPTGETSRGCIEVERTTFVPSGFLPVACRGMDALNTRRSIKAASFTESVIRDMTRLADLHGAINLGQGFPDFPAPEEVKEAARQAIADDHNQYPVTWGVPAFREAIAAKYLRDYGMTVDPETEICVTCGSTEAMIASMLGLLDPGDEVVVFEPFYENYGPDAIMSGRRSAWSRSGRRTGRSTKRSCAPPSATARARSSSTRRTTRPGRCSRARSWR